GRAGRGSDLDAPAVAALGWHGLHLLHYFGGFPHGAGTGQRCRIDAGAREHAATDPARLVSVAPGGGYCLDRLHARLFIALLADQSESFVQSLVDFPARLGALPMGDSSGNLSLGSELS